MIFYGLEKAYVTGDIDYLKLFQWLWISFGLLIIAGFVIESHLSTFKYVVLRLGSYKRWYQKLLKHCFMAWGIYIGFLLAFITARTIYDEPFDRILLCWILLSVNLLLCLSLFIVIIMICRITVAGIATMFMALSFGYIIFEKLGVSAKINPFVWGMLTRSTLYLGNSGFNFIAIILIESVVSLILMIGIQFYIKWTFQS